MLRLTTVLLSLLFVTPAIADGPSYNYLEGRYQRAEFDDSSIDVDGDGFGIAGSFEFSDSVHVFASFDTTEFDFDVDIDELVIGGGLHTALSDNVDFVANLSYVRIDAGTLGISIDDDGFGASIGLRGMVSDRFELAGFVDYIDLDDTGDNTTVRGEAWYNFTDAVAIGLRVGADDDITRYGIGARIYFD